VLASLRPGPIGPDTRGRKEGVATYNTRTAVFFSGPTTAGGREAQRTGAEQV